MENWSVYAKKADFHAIAEKFNISPILARIIRNRDVVEEEEIRRFLSGGISDLYDPHQLLDGEKLVLILVQKIKEQKPIRVIGDYDVDGIMSSYILGEGLKRCGAIYSIAIPHRMEDGYGLNVRLLEQAKKDGVDTILTCDNGISAIEEIALAKEWKMTVLVTDHHAIPFEMQGDVKVEKRSNADAIVNAHQKECAYPNKEMCGAAVCYKIVELLYEAMGVPTEELYDLLMPTAFATVCDIMSLTGENRILVKEGLKRIHSTKHVGLNALMNRCGVEKSLVDAYHFGFVLGPCMNASGRLDTAQKALRLMMEEDPKAAFVLADELVCLNEERKQMTLEGTQEAIALVEKEGYDKSSVILLYLPKVHESIAGLIAGKIKERYYRPTFILTQSQSNALYAKGSGRSIEGYPMSDRLTECEALLVKFGGHPMAAGLTTLCENIEILRQRLNENAALSEEDLTQKVRIDIAMPFRCCTLELAKELDKLGPFGKDNLRPIFALKNVRMISLRKMGKSGQFLRMILMDEEGSKIPCVFFGDSENFLAFLREKFGASQLENAFWNKDNLIMIKICYQLGINSFLGEENAQIELKNYAI